MADIIKHLEQLDDKLVAVCYEHPSWSDTVRDAIEEIKSLRSELLRERRMSHRMFDTINLMLDNLNDDPPFPASASLLGMSMIHSYEQFRERNKETK
jgi:hypothetical protein